MQWFAVGRLVELNLLGLRNLWAKGLVSEWKVIVGGG